MSVGRGKGTGGGGRAFLSLFFCARILFSTPRKAQPHLDLTPPHPPTMALSLKCGTCGVQLKSVFECQVRGKEEEGATRRAHTQPSAPPFSLISIPPSP